MTDLTPTKAKAAKNAIDAAIARKDVLAFARRMHTAWRDEVHLDRIGALLNAVDSGAIKKLAILLPPRHGKSTLCSMLYPAWYLGNHSTENVMLLTHHAELSERNGRAAREYARDARWPFVARLSSDSVSAARWNLVEGGGVYACGVEGSITGRGANVLILDDLAHDAGTEGERGALWRYYCEVVVPRLEPNAAIISIGTRQHEEDWFGRILAGPDAAEWTFLTLPAIAGDHDPLGRKVGEALAPDWVSAGELRARERDMGKRAFATQFNQNPMPLEGNLFKAAWFRRYDVVPGAFEKIVVAVDCASKVKHDNDFSASVKIGVTKDAFYVLDVWRAKCEFPDLLRRVRAFDDEPQRPDVIYIEDASAGTQVVQVLRAASRINVVPVHPKDSKERRAEACTGVIEAGRLYLPREGLLDFERELLAFPQGRNDDMVDALTLLLGQLQSKPRYAYSGEDFIDDEPLAPDVHADPLISAQREACNRIWPDAVATAQVQESALVGRVTAKMRGELY